MNGPKFKNGDIVRVGALGDGPEGMVIGVIHYINGCYGYWVTAYHKQNEVIMRHILDEAELRESPNNAA